MIDRALVMNELSTVSAKALQSNTIFALFAWSAKDSSATFIHTAYFEKKSDAQDWLDFMQRHYYQTNSEQYVNLNWNARVIDVIT